MAVAVLRAAHELGIAIPGELAVAGCDDTYVSEVSSPELGKLEGAQVRAGIRTGGADVDVSHYLGSFPHLES